MEFIYNPENTYYDQQPHSLPCDDDDRESIAISHMSADATGLSVRDMIKRYDSAAKRGNECPKEQCTIFTAPQNLPPAFKPGNANGMKPAVASPNAPPFAPPKPSDFDKSEKIKEVRCNLNRRFTQSSRQSSVDGNCSANDSNASSVANQEINTAHTQINLINSPTIQRRNSRTDLAYTQNDNFTELVAKQTPNNVTTCNRFAELNNEAVQLDTNDNSPVQTSYQSRTTISRSGVGVRITIDIFFDQENVSEPSPEAIASRIETDLPCSRILSEFQDRTIGSDRNSGSF